MAVVWPAAATLIQSLAWEIPYVEGVALKNNNNKIKTKGCNSYFWTYNILKKKFFLLVSKFGKNLVTPIFNFL